MKFAGGPVVAGIIASLLLLSQSAESSTDVVPGSDRKRNTGHYVSLNRFDKREVIADVALPGVSGVQRRYYWKSLEPEFGRYDLAEVRADLEAAREHGLQLVVFIEDKSFNGEIPTPPYLQGRHTVKNRSGGFIAVRWDAYVKERFKALIAEIGRQFDTDANFEGVAIQESAPSLDQDVLAELDYSPEAYRDALTDVLRSASESMPGSRVFWYMNFLPGRQAYLLQIADAVSGTGVVIGGPDVLPDNKALQKRTYPLYDKLAHQGLVFNSMQNDSYAHEHSSSEFDQKYWDLEQLFFFARDQLHVDYLFWNRKSWRKPADSHNWSEASAVILKHQDFGRN